MKCVAASKREAQGALKCQSQKENTLYGSLANLSELMLSSQCMAQQI